ncbi:hypothetical protein [uncultured Tenacibaculum sp.]|uniref:hypothetical protein n=1 Tax=uncultured Tenacibaculum sp. TaxID=174713 RepID=UPI002609D6F1|nr:hypothetical protein [uncultured Tenacibaculum sp.]
MTENNYEIKPLSSKDKKKISQQYVFLVIFLIFVGGIFFFIFKNVLKPAKFSTIPIIVFAIFLLFFLSIIVYTFWSTYIDLKKGIKHCYTGIITDKRIDKHTSSSKSFTSRAGNRSNSTTTKTSYYISVDIQEHSIPYTVYSKATIGDKIYLEVSPKNKEVLTFTILENHQQSIEVNNTLNFIPNKSKTMPMSQKEVDVVKKIFWKKMRKRLIFVIAFALLLLLLWQGIFIFIIPVLVAFVYASFKLLIEINNYATFFRNGKLKQITTVQVNDKLKITSNRNATKFRLVTNNGNIDVSENIYNKVKSNDIIDLHKASFITILIAVNFNSHNIYLFNETI